MVKARVARMRISMPATSDYWVNDASGEDRDIPPEVLNGLQVKLSELTLKHLRVFVDCWLACRLWDELHLGPFWRERLPDGKAEVPWFKVLAILTVRQRVAPGS